MADDPLTPPTPTTGRNRERDPASVTNPFDPPGLDPKDIGGLLGSYPTVGLGLSPSAPSFFPPPAPPPPPAPERKVVNAFFKMVDSLPGACAALVRWLILVWVFPVVMLRLQGATIDLDSPPGALKDSRAARAKMLQAVNAGGVHELFLVQAVALFVLDSIGRYYPEFQARIEPHLAPFSDFDQLNREWR